MKTNVELIESKVELIPDSFSPDDFVLSIVGAKKVLACPHFPPAIVPHPVLSNQQVFVSRGCGTWCVLFRLQFDSDNVGVCSQGCSGDNKCLNVLSITDKAAENSPEKKGGIILG